MIRSNVDDRADAADRNVLGGRLVPCSTDPMTGFYRDGCCRTGPDDLGVHTVCCEVTDEFLAFSKAAGNDLSTPHPEWGFPGLKGGDRWCLCAARLKQADEASAAPRVLLAGTHARTLDICDLERLRLHAIDG